LGWVGEPTQLTTNSIRVSQILGGPDQKLICIKICKKYSTQPDPNP